MPAAIFNGANVKILKDNLKGKSGWRLVGAGTYDYTLPTLSGNDTLVSQGTPVFTTYLTVDQVSSPGVPASGKNFLYTKSDDKLYLTYRSGTGTAVENQIGGSPYLGSDWIIRTNAQSIGEDITIPSTTNGMTAGPVTIASTYTVTVDGNWSVV